MKIHLKVYKFLNSKTIWWYKENKYVRTKPIVNYIEKELLFGKLIFEK